MPSPTNGGTIPGMHDSPLEDPNYMPRYAPENGRPPAIVAKWGAASQLRWFRRFWNQLGPMYERDLTDFYCHSVEHRGMCCASCMAEEDDTGWPTYDDHCCCVGVKAVGE